MLPALAVTVLINVAYTLPVTPITYRMKVDFAGYLPILGGQEDAEANVDMQFKVAAKDGKDAEGNPQASSELTSFEVKFGGAPLPFDVENAKSFFPKNTISFTVAGKILKNDAPDIALPVRLPGLDVKRIPDITYMPIEFPAGGIEVGKAFQYSKKFGDSEVAYTITPTKLDGSTLTLDVAMSQTYETLEDEAKNVVTKEVDGFSKVKTDVKGKGTVTFDTGRGLVTSSHIVADADSTAVEIKSKKSTSRKLKTTLDVSVAK